MAASREKLAPSTRPFTTRPSAKTTRMISSPPTTWAAVKIRPCGETMTPLPVSPPSETRATVAAVTLEATSCTCFCKSAMEETFPARLAPPDSRDTSPPTTKQQKLVILNSDIMKLPIIE